MPNVLHLPQRLALEYGGLGSGAPLEIPALISLNEGATDGEADCSHVDCGHFLFHLESEVKSSI